MQAESLPHNDRMPQSLPMFLSRKHYVGQLMTRAFGASLTQAVGLGCYEQTLGLYPQACFCPGADYHRAMKFLLAIIAYLLIGIVLGWGILLMMRSHNPWLLIVSVVAYIVFFGKI